MAKPANWTLKTPLSHPVAQWFVLLGAFVAVVALVRGVAGGRRPMPRHPHAAAKAHPHKATQPQEKPHAPQQ